jgi:hypothetical protein
MGNFNNSSAHTYLIQPFVATKIIDFTAKG